MTERGREGESVCLYSMYVCDREWGLRRASDRPEGECAERADHCSHTSQDTYLCLHRGEKHGEEDI